MYHLDLKKYISSSSVRTVSSTRRSQTDWWGFRHHSTPTWRVPGTTTRYQVPLVLTCFATGDTRATALQLQGVGSFTQRSNTLCEVKLVFRFIYFVSASMHGHFLLTSDTKIFHPFWEESQSIVMRSMDETQWSKFLSFFFPILSPCNVLSWRDGNWYPYY